MQDRATPAALRRPNHIPKIHLPLPPAPALTMQQVGGVMKRARKLRNRQQLTPYDFGVLDTLMFQCRNPRTGTIEVSYSALQRITGFARKTISKAIAKLTACSLVLKIKRRLRMAWHQGGTTSRQATNCYQFVAPPAGTDTEFPPKPVDKGLEITFISPRLTATTEAARAELDELTKRRQVQREAAWRVERAIKAKAGWISAC